MHLEDNGLTERWGRGGERSRAGVGVEDHPNAMLAPRYIVDLQKGGGEEKGWGGE